MSAHDLLFKVRGDCLANHVHGKLTSLIGGQRHHDFLIKQCQLLLSKVDDSLEGLQRVPRDQERGMSPHNGCPDGPLLATQENW